MHGFSIDQLKAVYCSTKSSVKVIRLYLILYLAQIWFLLSILSAMLKEIFMINTFQTTAFPNLNTALYFVYLFHPDFVFIYFVAMVYSQCFHVCFESMGDSSQWIPLSMVCKQLGPINRIPLTLLSASLLRIASFSLRKLAQMWLYAGKAFKLSKKKK